jgi:phage terminase small subunit
MIRSPLHQIVRDNAAVVRAFARELGFTPSAREGLHKPAAGSDDIDAWLAGAGTP